eukprot:SAG11_NODE_18794_length_481_cov_0.806283_2_plen_52_part_00
MHLAHEGNVARVALVIMADVCSQPQRGLLWRAKERKRNIRHVVQIMRKEDL